MPALMSAGPRWLELVADCLASPLTDLPAQQLAMALADTFDCSAVAYHLRLPGTAPTQQVWPAQHLPVEVELQIARYSRDLAARHHPVLRYFLRTGDPTACQVSDVPTGIAGHLVRNRWREFAAPLGIEHQLAMPVSPILTHRAFILARPEPFGDDEVGFARQLQRLLCGLDTQVRLFRQITGADHPAGNGDTVGLTPRQVSVLALMAQGLTARASARRLGISERTVHAHTARIYTQFGVHDRVSAVLAAQRAGVLSGSGRGGEIRP
jgi:DNA-binding CsgD family transcriptional regulator